MECVDGEYQTFKSKDGAYVREHFFGVDPELKQMVADWSDEEIWRLTRGGHDPQKVYAAYAAAAGHTGSPTVVLAKTVKGYGLGAAGEGQNIAHQSKKVAEPALRAFRDRFSIPVTDDDLLDHVTTETRRMHRRVRLGERVPQRHDRPRIGPAAAEHGIEPVARRLAPGDDHFTLETSDMALPGQWQIRLDVLVTDFDKPIFEFEVRIW
jgi:pyruvate dehydrogenase E1 component